MVPTLDITTAEEPTPIPAVSAAAFQNMQSAHDEVSEIESKLDALQQAMDRKVHQMGLAIERMSAELKRQKIQTAALSEMNERQLPRIDLL